MELHGETECCNACKERECLPDGLLHGEGTYVQIQQYPEASGTRERPKSMALNWMSVFRKQASKNICALSEGTMICIVQTH